MKHLWDQRQKLLLRACLPTVALSSPNTVCLWICLLSETRSYSGAGSVSSYTLLPSIQHWARSTVRVQLLNLQVLRLLPHCVCLWHQNQFFNWILAASQKPHRTALLPFPLLFLPLFFLSCFSFLSVLFSPHPLPLCLSCSFPLPFLSKSLPQGTEFS